MSLTIFLRYASEAAARDAFQSFGYAPDPEVGWQPDGAMDFLGQRFDYHVVGPAGVISAPTGNTFEVDGLTVPEMAPVPGYHVNLRWLGPPELVPDFGEARIYPVTPECIFSD